MAKCKNIPGTVFVGNRVYILPVTVFATRDETGQTLSLAVENKDIMITIPVAPIEDLIEVKE